MLDYTIAYVLCTYNPLFLTDQFSLKKLPLQFSLSHEASLFVFQLNEQIVATAGALFRCDAVFTMLVGALRMYLALNVSIGVR